MAGILSATSRRWLRALQSLQRADWNQADEELARLVNLAQNDPGIKALLGPLRDSQAYREFDAREWLRTRSRADVHGAGKTNLGLALDETSRLGQLLAITELAVELTGDRTLGLLEIGSTTYAGRSSRHFDRMQSAVETIVFPLWKFVDDELERRKEEGGDLKVGIIDNI